MNVNDYIKFDAHDLASLIKKGTVSAQEVLSCAMQRLDEVNPTLNAVVTQCPDLAHYWLNQLSGEEPYYGVPLLVKDLNHALIGIPCSEGSRFFANYIPDQNSDLIEQLIQLGFIPFAKTNVPELGLSYTTESALWGPCRNPYDNQRTAGGSSGGSAAAVAAGIAPIATASDGGGSIRIPAACCGLVGFKPTTNLMPTGPWASELWSGMATNFILARSLRDTTDLFQRLTTSRVPTFQTDKRLRISCLTGVFAAVPVDPVFMQAVNYSKELLQKANHQIDERSLSLDLEAIGACNLTLIAANTYAAITAYLTPGQTINANALEPITWEFYQRGQGLSAYDLIKAKNQLYQLVAPLHHLLTETDVVLTPALAQLPPFIGELNPQQEFNLYLQKHIDFCPFASLFNQAGLPAITIPIMQHKKLPISIQMASGKNKDMLLLALAKELE